MLVLPALRKPRPGDPEGLFSRAVSNLGAQSAALAAVSIASLMVARTGGPAVVGDYALLRVLPWLFAVILSCGLPTASAFFLAGDHAGDPRLRPTVTLLALSGAALAALTWLALAVALESLFFRHVPLGLVASMSFAVVTQLFTVTAKACCQGLGDIRGANLVILAEEGYFLLCYPALVYARGNRGIASVVPALIISGGLATLTSLHRLRQRRFFSRPWAPSTTLAKQIVTFGARGQLGNMLWLMNLRFDFLLLGAIAGPATLGIYAVASKFAELMRLVPTAMNYVLYPRFAELGTDRAITAARRLLPRATLVTLVLAPFMAVLSYIALPLVYGAAFLGAVVPAVVIIVGLTLEGAAAVSSAFLLGSGRPGLNSLAMGAGTVVTVGLDIALIPRFGAMGGAVTSAVAYLLTSVTLTAVANRVARAARPRGGGLIAPRWIGRDPDADDDVPPDVRVDTVLRRAVDVLLSAVALLLASPVMLLVSVAVRSTGRGPVLYRQVRVGRGGRPFTMLKFRSMVSTAASGPLITGRLDPRVTWVGAVIRATRLDELPQLVNVLKGDMTLIGPRPEVPRFVACYRPDELRVLRVRPGLTGAGQIYYIAEQAPAEGSCGDAEAYYEDVELHPKLSVDLAYLGRRCLRVDLSIVLRTVAVLLPDVGRRSLRRGGLAG